MRLDDKYVREQSDGNHPMNPEGTGLWGQEILRLRDYAKDMEDALRREALQARSAEGPVTVSDDAIEKMVKGTWIPPVKRLDEERATREEVLAHHEKETRHLYAVIQHLADKLGTTPCVCCGATKKEYEEAPVIKDRFSHHLQGTLLAAGTRVCIHADRGIIAHGQALGEVVKAVRDMGLENSDDILFSVVPGNPFPIYTPGHSVEPTLSSFPLDHVEKIIDWLRRKGHNDIADAVDRGDWG